jgi:uncharacterized protein (DUF1015 family)
MIRSVQKDLEPIFTIYDDPENKTVAFLNETIKTAPVIQVTDQFGVKHAVWSVTDPEKIRQLQVDLKDKPMVIADGHHRYESAAAYRDEMRQKTSWNEDSAFNFHMCLMVPVQVQGLIILPTHRLLTQVQLTSEVLELFKTYFTVTEIAANQETIDNFLAVNIAKHAFVAFDGSKAYGLVLKDEQAIEGLVEAEAETRFLDVVILRDVIFKHLLRIGELKIDENILYAGSNKEAFDMMKAGKAKLAFLLNPVSPVLVCELAQKHCRLPEKSTNFYPKPVSGLTILDIMPNESL